MSSTNLEAGVEKRRKRRRTIHLPSVDPDCYVAVRTVDFGKYEDRLHELSNKWGDLRQLLQPVADLAVKDALGQYFVDGVRRRFDLVTVLYDWAAGGTGRLPFITDVMRQRGSGEVVKMLLSVGMDPDLPDSRNTRPSHWCGDLSQRHLAEMIFPCRPCMQALCDDGCTPLAAADSSNYEENDEAPRRRTLRKDVKNYIKLHGFETKFPTLPELAIREMWFVVKNLLRRQVVAQSEFTEEVEGRTAAEWAEFSGELSVAQEIRYYAASISTRFDDTAKLMTAIAETLCDKEDEAAKVPKLEKQVEELQNEAVVKDANIEELSEAVAVLRARLEKAGVKCDRKNAVSSEDQVQRAGSSVDSGCELDTEKNGNLSDLETSHDAREQK